MDTKYEIKLESSIINPASFFNATNIIFLIAKIVGKSEHFMFDYLTVANTDNKIHFIWSNLDSAIANSIVVIAEEASLLVKIRHTNMTLMEREIPGEDINKPETAQYIINTVDKYINNNKGTMQ